jgi:hypothetical protein
MVYEVVTELNRARIGLFWEDVEDWEMCEKFRKGSGVSLT